MTSQRKSTSFIHFDGFFSLFRRRAAHGKWSRLQISSDNTIWSVLYRRRDKINQIVVGPFLSTRW